MQVLVYTQHTSLSSEWEEGATATPLFDPAPGPSETVAELLVTRVPHGPHSSPTKIHVPSFSLGWSNCLLI